MKQVITTALSAVTILFLGIVALQYRVDDLESDSLSGANAEAYNLTVDVSTDLTLIAGNAVPRILIILIVVSVIVLLLMTR